MAASRSTDELVILGSLRITPFDRTTVWVERANGEGGTFPKPEVTRFVREDDAKGLRAYFKENLP